jgi:hypothetical protein
LRGRSTSTDAEARKAAKAEANLLAKMSERPVPIEAVAWYMALHWEERLSASFGDYCQQRSLDTGENVPCGNRLIAWRRSHAEIMLELEDDDFVDKMDEDRVSHHARLTAVFDAAVGSEVDTPGSRLSPEERLM